MPATLPRQSFRCFMNSYARSGSRNTSSRAPRNFEGLGFSKRGAGIEDAHRAKLFTVFSVSIFEGVVHLRARSARPRW